MASTSTTDAAEAGATKAPSSSSATSHSSSSSPVIIYALDLDGVLVDSSSETALSGLLGAQRLWPDAGWVRTNEGATKWRDELLQRFRQVRPVLYVGWESILLVKLLADPNEGNPSVDDILQNFQSGWKERMVVATATSPSESTGRYTAEEYDRAFREARISWIAQDDAKDWINSHGFFDGACQAVRRFLSVHGDDRLYVITTKGKDFAERLLEKQGLYGGNNDNDDDDNKNRPTSMIRESHLYGLGSSSNSKSDVLRTILSDRGGDIGVMVEDNVATLQEMMASTIGGDMLPVVAGWGYNTDDQLNTARDEGYYVLSETDSGTLSTVLDDGMVERLYHEFKHKKTIY